MHFHSVGMEQIGKLLKLILALTLLSLSSISFAENPMADVIGTTGEFAKQNSNGAVASRRTADDLYQQALNNERAAWSKFPPNVALLSKALTQSKEAKAADDQAKEFARAAQHAIDTGRKSGDFNLKYYGVASEETITKLATTNSPLQPQAESTLGGYGMKLEADKMSIKTPFGNLPLNMSISALDKGLGAIAVSLGYSASDVSKGIQEGVASRDAIAAKHMASVNANLGGGFATAAPAGLPMPEEKPIAAAVPESKPAEAGAPVVANATDEAGRRQEELLRNRDKFLEKMGMEIEHKDPIHGPQTDLFKVVHMRYQSLRSEGEFDEREAGIPVAPVAKLMTKPILLPQPLARAPARAAQVKPAQNR